MKWFLVFGLIALLNTPNSLAGDSDEDSNSGSSDSSSSSDSGSSSESSSKSINVKITKAYVLSLNSHYFSPDYAYEIRKVNPTYNAAAVKFCVIKDLPSYTKVVVKVYGSTSESGTYSFIENYSFTLGDRTSKYHKYLPAGLLRAIQSSNILKKGTYISDDYGFFNFHKILTHKQLTYSHYKVVFNLECENEVFVSLDERFQCV